MEGVWKSQTGLVGHAFSLIRQPRRGIPLTHSYDLNYLFKLVFERLESMDRAARNEADVPAPQPQAGQQARISCSHEDAGRAQGSQPAETAGSGTDHGEDRREVDAESADRSERLPRGVRIRRGSEIRHLLKRGKRKRTTNLDVFFAASPASRSRLGLIVPKHGKRIVDRNRLKRQLREIGRRLVLPELHAAGVAVDVLIRARPAAYGVEFGRLAREVREAVEGLCSDES